MKYTIKEVSKILEDGVATKQLLTLVVERDNGVVSEHGKYIDLTADPKTEAIKYAAELEGVLKEPVVVTVEDVVVDKPDIAKADVDAEAEKLGIVAEVSLK